MRLLLFILSISGSFSSFSQQVQPEAQPISCAVTTTQSTTGTTTIITTVNENQLDVKQLQRPERLSEKPQIEEEKKKKSSK